MGKKNSDLLRVKTKSIQWLMVDGKQYLEKDFDLIDLASQTGMKVEDVEAVIQSVYQVSFAEYLRKLRVAYLLELMKRKDNRHSVEDLSRMSGFSDVEQMKEAFFVEIGTSFCK